MAHIWCGGALCSLVCPILLWGLSYKKKKKKRTCQKTRRRRMLKLKRPNQRCVKRLKVQHGTMASFKEDIWMVVCSHLFFSPHRIFRMMCASKGIWLALRNNPVWWEALYERVRRSQECLYCSHYAGLMDSYASHPNKQLVLQLLFVKACNDCGAQSRQGIMHSLSARLCLYCSQQRMVSNRVLMVKYGLHYSDLMPAYCARGGVLLMRYQHSKRHVSPKSELLRLTSEPIDYEYWKEEQPWKNSRLLFFAKRDLESLLGISLEAEHRAQARRVQAVARLGDHMRMSNVRGGFQMTDAHVSDLVTTARRRAIQHSMSGQQQPAALLMLGGPYMLHRGLRFQHREGHTVESVNHLKRLLATVQTQMLFKHP
jgi:hypothetical protein